MVSVDSPGKGSVIFCFHWPHRGIFVVYEISDIKAVSTVHVHRAKCTLCREHTHNSASACRISSKLNHSRNKYGVVSISKQAATASQFYFRFRFSRFCSFGERDIPIHCSDITTSGFWKQTSAMFEICFLFRFLRLRHYRYVILHFPTNFTQIGMTGRQSLGHVAYRNSPTNKPQEEIRWIGLRAPRKWLWSLKFV